MTSKRDPNSSKAGYPSPDSNLNTQDGYDPSPAQVLLARHIQAGPQQRTLLINTGPEILPAGLAERLSGGQLTWMGRDYSSLRRAQDRCKDYPAIQAHISFEVDLPQAAYASFDQVALLIPKSRSLTRRWIMAAFLALKPGANLYLAGPNDLGVRSLVKDAEEVFSSATILGYKKGNRVARLHKPFDRPAVPAPPDWTSEPGIAPGTWQEIRFDWGRSSWHFYSLPGVFSSSQLDEGTRLLLDAVQIPPGANVLDFGCGWGAIGILAARLGAGSVDLLDVDLLAIASARKNAAAYQLVEAHCLAGDGLEPVTDRRYTLILSNPPFHAGKPVSYRVTDELIASSGRLLEKGGQLILVANRFIPYQNSLQRYYRKVVRLAETGRFQVLAARSPKKSA